MDKNFISICILAVFCFVEKNYSSDAPFNVGYGPLIMINNKGNFIYGPTQEQRSQGVETVVYVPKPPEKVILYYDSGISQEIFANGGGLIRYPDGTREKIVNNLSPKK